MSKAARKLSGNLRQVKLLPGRTELTLSQAKRCLAVELLLVHCKVQDARQQASSAAPAPAHMGHSVQGCLMLCKML